MSMAVASGIAWRAKCVLNPISDVADEFLDPISGMPVSFHVVLVELTIVFV